MCVTIRQEELPDLVTEETIDRLLEHRREYGGEDGAYWLLDDLTEVVDLIAAEDRLREDPEL
jgi:hypothetical protein